MAPKQKQALFALLSWTWAIGIYCYFLVPALFHVPQWVSVLIFIAVIVATPVVICGWWLGVTGHYLEEDERDRIIMGRVSKFQNYATILALGAWMVFFLLSYADNDTVPAWLVPLVIGSTVFITVLVQSAGVLIAYWLANRQVTKP